MLTGYNVLGYGLFLLLAIVFCFRPNPFDLVQRGYVRLSFWERWAVMLGYKSRRLIHCSCGHWSQWKTIIMIDGRSGIYTVDRLAGNNCCAACWQRAVIYCEFCQRPILPGDRISFHLLPKRPPEGSSHTVFYFDGLGWSISCGRNSCSASRPDYVGTWEWDRRPQPLDFSPDECLALKREQVTIPDEHRSFSPAEPSDN